MPGGPFSVQSRTPRATQAYTTAAAAAAINSVDRVLTIDGAEYTQKHYVALTLEPANWFCSRPSVAFKCISIYNIHADTCVVLNV